MFSKSCPVLGVKAGPDDGLEEGQFEALVSVFGNKDAYGDVVIPGAFAETLQEWKDSGNPIPVVWSHQYADPEFHIGVVVDAAERSVGAKSGLWVRGQLDVDEDARKARQVARLLKGRRVSQFSFTYDVLDGAFAKSEELGDYYELRRLKLYEVGPTLIGANQQTELINAKALQDLVAAARGAKAGRVLSAKNETALRTAHDAIGEVLSALDSDEGKAGTGEPAAAEDRASGKAGQPMHRVLAELDVLALELDLPA